MPPNQSPRGALPARFKRQRILIVGCGDVGQRVARLWTQGVGNFYKKTAGCASRVGIDVSKNIAISDRHVAAGLRDWPSAYEACRLPLVRALTSSPDKCAGLRAQGITPLLGNLDVPASLRRLAGLAQRVVHLAPPAAAAQDRRTQALLQALVQGLARSRGQGGVGTAPTIVYGSTSGVYGDWQGAWVDETCALRATTERALRRVDAERQIRQWARRFVHSGASAHVLRIPGIYAGDREGGTPVARLLRGTPVLRASDDVFTSHIHADDLARAVALALWRGKPQRVTNVADQSAMRMGAYFALAAELWQLPAPRPISRAEAVQQLSPVLLSFMSESRRLCNQRMRRELGLVLRYPTVREGLEAAKNIGEKCF